MTRLSVVQRTWVRIPDSQKKIGSKKLKETNKSATESEIEKQKVLEWQLLKSGLFLPGLQDKSNFECIIEGLRLVSDSLIRRQEEKLHSLKL